MSVILQVFCVFLAVFTLISNKVLHRVKLHNISKTELFFIQKILLIRNPALYINTYHSNMMHLNNNMILQ